MAYEPVELVEVHAFGVFVGAVGRAPDNTFVFEYDPVWAARGIELAPFRMPVVGGRYAFPDLNPQTFHGLPPLLADSLPDAFGNALIDRWMAANGLDPEHITALDRLAYMASRGLGALEFRPPARVDAEEPPTAIQLADLVTAARAQVSGQIDQDDVVTVQALEDLIRVGTSAGGARAKAVVAYNPNTGQMRSGQLGAPDGYSHWLIKLDGVADETREFGTGNGYGRIEYAYSLMARDAGLEMTDCQLLLEHDRAHFMTRRFDRTEEGDRLHLLTLCALDHLDFNVKGVHDYAQYLQSIDRLRLGPDALEEAFARIVFNVAAVNCDDHTKNLSFLMHPDGQWRLAPAYDLIYAYNPRGKWTDAHQMTVNGKAVGISAEDLLDLADRFKVPSPTGVLARINAAVHRWFEHADAAGIEERMAAKIAQSHHVHGLHET